MDKYLLQGFENELKRVNAIKESLISHIKEDLLHTDLLIGYTLRVLPYGVEIVIPCKAADEKYIFEKNIFLIIDLDSIRLCQSPDRIYKSYWELDIWEFTNKYDEALEKILFNIKLIIDFWSKNG